MEELKPNEKEKEVLSLFYNRFYDLYEEVGMKFCMVVMRAILDTQVEDSEVPDIKIMSQVYLPIKQKVKIQ